MIAIGGVIVSHPTLASLFLLINYQGTGLFLGTASDLKNGGPAGLLIGYCIMASLLYSVMVRQTPTNHIFLARTNDCVQVALGEMVSQFPIPGGQFALAGRFNSPELGFAMGILFWYK
jgi:amino acid transporter